MDKYAGANCVLGSIWVGDYTSAKDWVGDNVIFVHHDIQWYIKGLHLPLLKVRPRSAEDRTGAEVNRNNLALIHSLIQENIETGDPLLIHCKGGVERSPLCVASYLVTYSTNRLSWDWNSAYEHLKKTRPVVEDRRYWLD